MAVAWTEHRFSGGVLALNVTNTIVNPHRPEVSFDRFDDPAEIGRFTQAANIHCAGELGGRVLAAPDPAAIWKKTIAMRGATDRLFRRRAEQGVLHTASLADFLAVAAESLRGHDETIREDGPFGDPARPLAFEAGVALSALSLLDRERQGRIRICGHCAWLFLDRSRNTSRLWCDMAVCGNRQKARRHYRRRQMAQGESIDG